MDKNAIKKYAIWARNELITRVTQKAEQYEITKTKITPAEADSIGGYLLTDAEKNQRKALIEKIRADGFEQVMEEVAYTWFNRFTALRFMEVNNYLPSHTRVFTNENGEFKPQILSEAMHLDLDGLNMDKVYELKNASKDEELFRYLLIVQCNALNKILHGLFEQIEDFTELLLPDNLLRDGSVIEVMVSELDESNWIDEVEIIGWLYQYYISEKHEEVVNPLYGKGIKKEDIPAATQVFTTDWIVRYMVDNSLGRYWIERNTNSLLVNKLAFYVPSEVFAECNNQLDPTQIEFFDPCLGSGHILSYAFDVFLEIYRECGFTDKEATENILKYNLWGLDIDDRAYQLASFAIMMKARRYNRKIFSSNFHLNIVAIQESNGLPSKPMYIDAPTEVAEIGSELVKSFRDAKEIGSLLAGPSINTQVIKDYLEAFEAESVNNLDKYVWNASVYRKITELVEQTEIMQKRYTIVCTNPPYMNNLKGELKKYIFKNYKDYSGDIFSAFIVRNLRYTLPEGYAAFMTPNVWMYIKSFEKLRLMLISQKSITSFLLLAKGAFYKEATVDICSFVISNSAGLEGNYIRLEQYKGDMDNQKEAFLNRNQLKNDGNIFYCNKEKFFKIPGNPLAFWVSDNLLSTFEKKSIESITISKAGIVSGNDALFLKLWYEVVFPDITFDAINFDNQQVYKWVPINKGGAFRRYYGNHEYIINVYDLWNSSEKTNESVRRSDPKYYFKAAMTWSYVTTGKSSFRYTSNKTSATAAPNLFFFNNEELFYTLAFANCCITQNYLDLLNPTINLNVTNVSTLPIIIDPRMKETVIDLCKSNINDCKDDWDSFETSWDFQCHPIVQAYFDNISYQNSGLLQGRNPHLIKDCYIQWATDCNLRFETLRRNEEELNRIFIDIYGLQDELTPEVEDKDVTVRKADLQRDIKSLISYAVGCMFGRYSIYKQGLIYAGGNFDEVYGDFPIETVSINPDIAHGTAFYEYGAPVDTYEKVYLKDIEHMEDAEIFWGVTGSNIIPITDDEYFTDDIVEQFVDFIRIVYGEKSLDTNLKFIADALGGKGQPKEVIRNYFMNDFFKDHCKIYQKRPIYWLFDSGKKNGFKCLIYMHRYQPDTIARIRTDYVHEQQSRYRTAIEDLEQRISNAETEERVKLNRQLVKLQDQAEELRIYEEKIHHLADQMISIDLDDGVKVNYAKFQDVLAKIK